MINNGKCIIGSDLLLYIYALHFVSYIMLNDIELNNIHIYITIIVNITWHMNTK